MSLFFVDIKLGEILKKFYFNVNVNHWNWLYSYFPVYLRIFIDSYTHSCLKAVHNQIF